MIRLFKFLVVLAVAVVFFGFFRGWFTAKPTRAADGNHALLFTWDPSKIKGDLFKAKDQVHSLAKAAFLKVKELATRKNDFPFDLFITASYSLAQTTEALQAMESYAVVKPVILPTLA